MARFQRPVPRKRQKIGVGGTIVAFLCKKLANCDSVCSTGIELYSYLLPIGRWIEDNKIEMPKDVEGRSRTNKRHMKMLRDMAAAQDIEIVESSQYSPQGWE